MAELTGQELVKVGALKGAYDNLDQKFEKAKSSISNIETGYLYIPSEVKCGYLHTSGNFIEETLGTANRVTFVEYLKMAFPCEIYIDTGYSITLCLYNNDETLINRANVSSPNRAYIPQDTLFRISVMSLPESKVTDIIERSHHCRIIGAYGQTVVPLTSNDDVNDIKEPGFYSPKALSKPTNWPGSYGIMTVLKAHGGTVYQYIVDNQCAFFSRRYSTSVGWNAWESYAKNSVVQNALAPGAEEGISSSNYTDYFSDANLAPAGRSYFILANITNQMIANLPAYGVFSYLITFNSIRDNEHGRIQLFAQKDGAVWYRTETGSSSYGYSGWRKFVTDDDTDNFFMPGASEGVSSSTYTRYFTDANLAPSNKTYYIVSNITSQMVSHLPIYGQNGFLMTFKILKENDHARVQIYSVKSTGQMWYRLETGSETTYNYSQWYEFATKDDVKAVVPLAAKIFKRVGCIGDSYTAGYIKIGTDTQRLAAYAWPHYMETLTGHIWTNFGVSGSSCKSWMQGGTYSKLSEVQAQGNKCQAYVIGLALNDSTSSSPNYVAVGTSADIGTDADSYYAYYYKLIAAVHAVNTSAPIFCNTCPQSASRLTNYNQAVRDIVAYCQQHDMPVYLCDLAGPKYYTKVYYDSPIFTSDYLNSHYSTIGYEMMAECYLRVLSEIIVENVSDFQGVHLIEYDEPT